MVAAVIVTYDPPVDSRRLRYFVQIVDSGSITRAAAASGIAQPALSQQLAILEHELKVKLLDRSVSGVTPTPAGKVLYARAQAILRQFDDLHEAVHREVQPLSGTVIVGIPPTMLPRFGLPLIEKVCTQHPEIRLQIREEGSLVLHELLVNGNIELSISATRPEGVVTGEEILSEAIVLIHAPSMSLPEQPTLAALARLPWVMPRRPNAIRTLVDGAFAAQNLTPRIVVEIDSLHSAMEIVRRGFAVAPMSMAAMHEDLQAGTLLARPLGDTPLLRSLYLAYRRSPGLTPAAQFVHGILRDLSVE
jgi:LysR family nitrogen assimilation transcriptional regulator|nr:MAG: nitrogen assimilation transcriptional regulator [Pseudomonadota bacterium]